MKSWFKKIGQKLYGKTPADKTLKSEEKKVPLKEKLSTTAYTEENQVEDTPVITRKHLLQRLKKPTPVEDTQIKTCCKGYR